MATAEEIDDALTNVLPNYGIDQLKPEQRQILDCLMKKEDCLAVLPTGYGKSLPFQLLPAIASALQPSNALREHVLVCCPLVSLMKDQVDALSKIPDITAGYKGIYITAFSAKIYS